MYHIIPVTYTNWQNPHKIATRKKIYGADFIGVTETQLSELSKVWQQVYGSSTARNWQSCDKSSKSVSSLTVPFLHCCLFLTVSHLRSTACMPSCLPFSKTFRTALRSNSLPSPLSTVTNMRHPMSQMWYKWAMDASVSPVSSSGQAWICLFKSLVTKFKCSHIQLLLEEPEQAYF